MPSSAAQVMCALFTIGHCCAFCAVRNDGETVG
jgi:hypothetical protein